MDLSLASPPPTFTRKRSLIPACRRIHDIIAASQHRVIAILTSIIIPILTEGDKEAAAQLCPSDLEGSSQVVVVLAKRVNPNLTGLPGSAAVVSSTGVIRAVLLNDGAAAAGGDIFLFLWPDCRLPKNAVTAIERNLSLLPQAIGGNFHVRFDDDSRFTKALTVFLKKWRYRGHYYGNSGIFVRKDVYLALGGFRPYHLLEDYDFARRMERYGPTLYLPDTMSASARKFRRQKVRATALRLTAQALFSLGLHSDRLARACLES